LVNFSAAVQPIEWMDFFHSFFYSYG